jgi:hypothetical protein
MLESYSFISGFKSTFTNIKNEFTAVQAIFTKVAKKWKRCFIALVDSSTSTFNQSLSTMPERNKNGAKLAMFQRSNKKN